MTTRTVFVVMLMTLMAANCFGGTFSDVPADHWAYDAVEKAAGLGLVVGRGDGTFKGDKPPSRYELAMGMSKVLAEIENRMKARPIFTRKVLDQLRNLNVYLAGQVDEIRHRQRYILFLLENHYKNEHNNRPMPDLRAQFNQAVAQRLEKKLQRTGGGSKTE